jgi:predicted enzyme related to lactoylglutathione lyase
MSLRDRVVELRRVPADQLLPHPRNWRTHPKVQRNALRGALDEVGFAGAALARKDADGGLVLIDGHLRKELLPGETIPVLVTDLTEAEGEMVLATLDPIGAMARREQMKIALTSVYVDDQAKALRVYTEVLGFVKKADFSQGPFRWLTVASPEEPKGTELQLALNDNPAAKAYQQAMFQQGQPAAMFYADDLQADYERMKAHGAQFIMPPTEVTGSKIARLNDTCGNLVQVTQLMR